MARSFVAEVESNLKGGVRCELGPKTLIVGPSGSGKSAVVNAVELALTGRVSDLAGRTDVGQEATLMALAPGRVGKLYADAKLSDGGKAHWETTGAKTGSAKRATHELPHGVVVDQVLPLRELRKAITGDPETARRFFLKRFVRITDADVEERIPSVLLDHYKRTLVGCGPRDDALTKLLAALEQAGVKARECNTRVKAAATAAGATAQGLAAPPTDEQVAEAWARVNAARDAVEAALTLRERILGAKRNAEQLSGLQGQFEQMQRDQEALQAQLSQLEASRAQAVAEAKALPQTKGLTSEQRALVDTLANHARRAEAAPGEQVECYTCGQFAHSSVFTERSTAVSQMLFGVDAEHQRVQARYAELDSAYRHLTVQISSTNEKLKWGAQSIESMRSSLEAAQISAAQVSNAELPNIDALRERESEARSAVRELEGRREGWKVATRARDEVVLAEREVSEWKQLETACSTAVEQLLDASIITLVAEVQKRLPKADKFDLRLREGSREVFQLGLVRNGVLESALSGSEWARVTAALADVIAPGDGPAVIIPEDRSFDPEALAATLAAFSETSAQVIFVSTTQPARIPVGWKVIQTELGEHRMMPGPTPLKQIDSRVVAAAEKLVEVMPAGATVTALEAAPVPEPVPEKKSRKPRASKAKAPAKEEIPDLADLVAPDGALPGQQALPFEPLAPTPEADLNKGGTTIRRGRITIIDQ